MNGTLHLSLARLAHHRWSSLILTACIAVAIFLPLAAQVLTASYDSDLRARAASTPLIAGARGNRFDLTLATLWWRRTTLPTIPMSELEALGTGSASIAIPIHVRFTAQRHPVVGTSPEYFELHGLRAVRGTLPLEIGDCTLGSSVARALALGPGDELFSDQVEVYDIAKPPALLMSVAGVLAETGTPDDDAVFVDIKTSWILEGIAHGHDDVRRIDPKFVLGTGGGHTALSQAMIEYNKVTDANLASFHYHGDASQLPLTSIIVVPRSDKARTIVKARINTSKLWQMVAPSAVIADLMAFVLRIKSLFDSLSIVLAGCTVVMTALIVVLSMRLRAREMQTLDHIGCSRGTVFRLYATEIAIVVGVAVVVAGLALVAALALLPDLVRSL